jgi:prepilin-type processing-associated H-X9-DG protein
MHVDPTFAPRTGDTSQPGSRTQEHTLGEIFDQETKRQHPGGMHGLLADGSVRFLRENLDPATLQGLCTVSGLEEIGEF